MVYDELLSGEKKLAVIGLGYVGLPLALAFAEKIPVIGFDQKEERIRSLNLHSDPNGEVSPAAFENRNIVFTSDAGQLQQASCFLIAVPTTVDEYKVPDLSHLLSASETVGKALKKGDLVVFESTVYPGCTEEDCIPVLERVSGLKPGIDFFFGYSPERINPGDPHRNISNTTKIVAGNNEEALEEIARLYETIVEAGVHRAPSIKVAESAKIVENVQRDLNISLMNELSIIFTRMNIATHDVLAAAGTKWNFMPYYPGLVGGHCIGVDPYYLTHKAQQLGYDSKVIAAGRSVNDDMPRYIAKKIVQHVIKTVKNTEDAKILVLGATFKENVTDIRNAKVADMVKELLEYSLSVDFVDLRARPEEVKSEYGLELKKEPGTGYHAVVLAVPHKEYCGFTQEDLNTMLKPEGLFADVKGIYRNKFEKINYWSL